MPRLAFSSNAFKKNTLDEAIDAVGGIGYAGIELMADIPHALPASFSGPARDAAARHLQDQRLAVSNINAFTLFACGDTYNPTWIADDSAACERRIQHTLGAIQLAHRFGAATVSLQPGGPLIGSSLSRRQAGERFRDGLSRVIPLARELNIILAIEPEPGLFIQTAQEYLDFKNDFFPDEPVVQMNCDIGHLFCVGDDPAWVIHNLAPHIAHIHMEDIGANRVHQHLTPGKGAIDFDRVFAAIRDIQYAGWVTVELYPYETTAAGVAQAAFTHLLPIARRHMHD